MARTLDHRGPDGHGEWLAPSGGCGLAHTRLSIIDIDGGHQPMASHDGRYVIVFNGEIYNYRALRGELDALGHRFETKSDTEVIIEAFRAWGPECLERFRGMFAFALFDSEAGELFLARDRTGIKPLYYFPGSAGFYFASELKAILAAEGVPRRLDYQALSDFLVLGYCLAPRTFFSDVRELIPGTWLKLGHDGIVSRRYWQWERAPEDWDESTALDYTEKALVRSLEEHLVADVPIGAFLSGGIDSSLLIALLVRDLDVHLDTFNVAFSDAAFDESPHARAVAEALGTRHHQITVEGSGADLALVDQVLLQFDQPFGDSSAIPSYLISREIRKYVKVAIAGDGGDEMFGGYRYFQQADLVRLAARAPRLLIAAGLRIPARLGRVAPDHFRRGRRFLRTVAMRDHSRLVALKCYTLPEDLSGVLRPEVLRAVGDYVPSLAVKQSLMEDTGGPDLVDAQIVHALPNDYLRKVDVASSAHGLEVRVPLLGEHVLEHAQRLPNHLRYNLRTSKLLLRKLALRYLPRGVVERRKQGFSIPLDSWLGGEGRRELGAILTAPDAQVRQLVRGDHLDEVVTGFVSQQWDRTRYSRYNLYQQVYFLWGLERWLQTWDPEL